MIPKEASYASSLAGACGILLLTPGIACAQTDNIRDDIQISDIVVTAQKREERVQDIGMSIQAASGEALTRLGIQDTTDLVKIVPGLAVTSTAGAPPVFSIRGVGYQDTSLAASPTVSINEDEIPLPFSVEAVGSTLDLQRVEVLKGPQGTLFGTNATGGAINYIAAKPTDELDAGFNASFSRFNTLDVDGFVSGPVSDTLAIRVSGRRLTADGRQKSYTRDDRLGERDIFSGRFSALWEPANGLRVLATVSGFIDRSETQAGQYFGVLPLSPLTPLDPGFLNYPVAPQDNRAADWGNCVNNTPFNTGCVGFRQKNRFLKTALRIDYNLGSDLTLTSLSSYQRFKYFSPSDSDGTTYKIYELVRTGRVETYYQELRLNGRFGGGGNWIVGANYEDDRTREFNLTTYQDSSVAVPFGIQVIGTNLIATQRRKAYAAFAHVEYPVLPSLTINAGVRYTKTDIDATGAALDNGNGLYATLVQLLQNTLVTGDPFVGPGINVGAGGPVSLGPPPDYTPGIFRGQLNEDNISWRVGLDWKAAPDFLLYGNVSRGYKAGSFPSLGASLQSQYTPVVQESLLAFEAGMKSELFNRTLQLNAAAFYYDYSNKQILGSSPDPIYGALPRLVNIPKSHVIGFEISGIWKPVRGLTLTPSFSYSHSRIDGNFTTTNYLSQPENVSGERFPLVPEVQAFVDAQYDWRIGTDLTAFIGGNITYQGGYNSSFGEFDILKVNDYALVDLRAGLEYGKWRLQLWGRNVFDKFYVNNKVHIVDAYVQYAGNPATYGATVSYRFR